LRLRRSRRVTRYTKRIFRKLEVNKK
jgi:hypothetical protein